MNHQNPQNISSMCLSSKYTVYKYTFLETLLYNPVDDYFLKALCSSTSCNNMSTHCITCLYNESKTIVVKTEKSKEAGKKCITSKVFVSNQQKSWADLHITSCLIICDGFLMWLPPWLQSKKILVCCYFSLSIQTSFSKTDLKTASSIKVSKSMLKVKEV